MLQVHLKRTMIFARIHLIRGRAFSHMVEGEDAGAEVQPYGLAQKWCLNARYASFCSDELICRGCGRADLRHEWWHSIVNTQTI